VVDFYSTTSLSSADESDILNNPELNLAAVGSMATGWYVFQFAAAVSGAATSPYNSRFTISGLLWDRFGSGTPAAGSLADLNFVLLNSAVKPRNYPLEDVGQPRVYRAASSGMSVDDATPLTFTGAATSLATLAPANLRGARNTAGDLLIEWTRRDRFAHGLRDNAGTPLGEEREIYAVEIYDGSTLKHSERVTAESHIGEHVRWHSRGSSALGDPTQDSEGSVYINNPIGGPLGAFVSEQVLTGDFIFEFGADAANTDLPSFVIIQRQGAESSLTPPIFYMARGVPGNANCAFNDQVSNEAVDLTYPARVYFIRTGNQLRAYIDYSSPSNPPVLIGAKEYSGPLTIQTYSTVANTTNVLLRPRLSFTRARSFLYTANAQTDEFGSAQSSIKVRVYQESSIIGKGAFAEATL
jgi:hypothetical protein